MASEDEWYKAAYYKNGAYSLYANGTSTAPYDGKGGTNYISAICYTWDGTVNGALEQNGTKDMMGNVFEWNDAIAYADMWSPARGLRGGTFWRAENFLRSSSRSSAYPVYQDYDIGFRVVAVPEPSSIIALLGGLTGLIGLRRRKA